MPFQKGVPYYEALRRLDQNFSPKAGDLILYEPIWAVIQADKGRRNGILYAWFKLLRSRGLIPSRSGRARGIGVAFLNGREDGTECDHKTHLYGRNHKRLRDRVHAIDTKDFTEAELAQHNLRKRHADAIANSLKEANKDLSPPPPVKGDNVRLFKKSS